MSIGNKAAKGFMSFFYRSMLEKFMGIFTMIVLARKLTPYDFGLVSITEVLLTLISVFGTTGLSEFLLAYRKDDTEEIFKAAFWFNALITLVIFILFIIAAPIWAHYQKDDRIINLSLISGLVFISSQLQTLPKTWLNKNLMFETLVKLQAPFIIIIALAKIIAALLGLGVYSLVIPTLIFQPVLTLVLFRATTINPGRKLFLHRWKEIYHFTKHLIGSTLLSRIADQGDKIILSKFLGLDKLGIYNLASQMAEMVTSQLVMLSNNVLSSVLPKYVNDKERFYTHYSGFLKAFAFAVFPILAIMLIAAKPIILILYGPKWLAAVLPMQLLIVYAAFRAVTSSYGSVMNSFHLNKKSFIVTLVYTPFHLAGSIIGSFYGITGVALSVLIVKISFINWNIKQIMDAVGKQFGKWYANLAPYFISCILLAIIVSLALYPFQLKALPMLVLTGVCFLTGYFLLFKLLFSAELERLSLLIGSTFPKMQRYFNYVFSI